MTGTRRRCIPRPHNADPVFAAYVHRSVQGRRGKPLYAETTRQESTPIPEQDEHWEALVNQHLRDSARAPSRDLLSQSRDLRIQMRSPKPQALRPEEESRRRSAPPPPTVTPPPFLQPPSMPPDMLLPEMYPQHRQPPLAEDFGASRRAASTPEKTRRASPAGTLGSSAPGASPSADTCGSVPSRASSSSGNRPAPGHATRAAQQQKKQESQPPRAAWSDGAGPKEKQPSKWKFRAGHWIWGPLLGKQVGRTALTPEEVAAEQAAEISRRTTALIEEVEQMLASTEGRPASERKKVFRDLQRRFHPDKNAETIEISKVVFQRLMDNRRSYLGAA